jgi:hypothetical protein
MGSSFALFFICTYMRVQDSNFLRIDCGSRISSRWYGVLRTVAKDVMLIDKILSRRAAAVWATTS